MTDGIIQQTINEFINMEINARKKGFDSIYESNEQLLQALQQELIENIKQEFDNDNEEGYAFHTIRKKLIGDNQE